MQVTVGYSKEEIEQPEIVFNGKVFSEGGKQLIDVPEYSSLNVQVPVIGYCWEHVSSSNPSISRVLLAPWVVEALSLGFDPTNLNYTVSGNLKVY